MRRQLAIKAISLLWLGSILGAGCAFLTQVLIARELGPGAFGAFAAALATVSLVTPLASFGVGGFWLKVFGEEGWQAVRWLRGSLRFATYTTVLALALILIWAQFGPHDDVTRYLLVLLATYVLGQVGVELVSAKLQLEGRYAVLALWQFLPHLLRLLLVAVFMVAVLEVMTPNRVAYIYALISISVFLAAALVIWRMFQGRLALQGHGPRDVSASGVGRSFNMREVAKQTWPFGLAGVFHLVYFQSDVILLKYLDGDEAAGIYNVAFLIMTAVYMLPSVIFQKFLLPKIHRWASHDRTQFYQVYRSGNKIMLFVGVLAMLSIWLLAPWGVVLLFDHSYLGAVLPLTILALGAPIRFVATSVGSVLVTLEHMRAKVLYMGITAVINIGLNLWLIPLYGVAGAAVATVASEVVLLLLYFKGTKRVFNKSDVTL